MTPYPPTRRAFLVAGGMSYFGIDLAGRAADGPAAPAARRKAAKSAIMIWLSGGASLGYQLAAPLSGGLAPLVATALLAWSGGDPWPVGVYLVGMAAVTVVSVLLAAETGRRALADEGGPG